MQRRRFVLLGMGALIPGCLTWSAPEQQNSAQGPATPDGNGKISLGEYWHYVETADERDEAPIAPEVESVAIKSVQMVVEMQFHGGSMGATRTQIGLAAGYYAVYVHDHGGPSQFKGIVVDAFGETQATFHCEQEWAETYNDGEATWGEFVDKVAQTYG